MLRRPCRMPFGVRRAVVVAGLIGLPGIVAVAQPPPGPPASEQPALPVLVMSPLAAPSPKDDDLQKLRKERYMTAFRLAQLARAEFQAGLPNGTIDFPLQLHLQALQAELDLGPSPAERVKVWEQIVEVARIDEWVSERRFKAGRIPVQEHEASRYQYLDAKIHLLEAKQEAAKGGRK